MRKVYTYPAAAKIDLPNSGEVECGSNAVGYYAQENQQLDESKAVLDELWTPIPTLLNTNRSALALFLFKGDDVGKRVASLSGVACKAHADKACCRK